jgi:predicted amidohydrolase
MRIALGQLAPAPGDVAGNVERAGAAVRAARAEIAVFPELFLSGYRLGDRFHPLALRPTDPILGTLADLARASSCTLVVGTPVASAERSGEIRNAALAVPPDGPPAVQVKRYLPNFGPFEEAIPFTPTDASRPVTLVGRPVGLEICYDAFFPEVSRELALAGAELLLVLSASPVTSRRLFERLLPARAIENACPVVYVNRVGVEDGIVFGGGSGAWDPRGEPFAETPVPLAGLGPEERLTTVEVDLAASARWRPFRPVLRDLASRSPPAPRPPSP